MNLNPLRSVLLIVDLQNDFLHPDGAYVRGQCANPKAQALPERVKPVAQALKTAGGLVVSSHFTLWPTSRGEPMISPHLRQMRPFLRRGDFAPDSWGQKDVDLLQPLIDFSVRKVAYSAFFNTQLDWALRKAGIENLVVCGIVTNGGVASTVRDAHMRDYHVVVLSDACAAFSDLVHETSLADMATVAQVMTCHEFLQSLGGKP
jgi:ureidoacrylate peracid hydrolase